MGLIIGFWYFGETQTDLPLDELSAMAAIAQRLQAATGLRAEHAEYTLWLPALDDGLFGWQYLDRTVPVEGWTGTAEEWQESHSWGAGDRAVEVRSFIPAHPYLWENFDAVMTAAGGRCGTFGGVGWEPNPAHARLRMRWDALPRRNRILLKIPSLWGLRPFDRLLSQTAD